MHSDPFDKLINTAALGTYFTAFDGQAFARIRVARSGGFYMLAVRSHAYREWFYYEFFNRFNTLPNPFSFHTLLNHVESLARQGPDCQRLAVWRRVAARGRGHRCPEQIILDLANPDCEFVEITPERWRVDAGPGIAFLTSLPTIPLRTPIQSDDPTAAIETFRSFLNLSSRSDWLRCLAWILAAMRPTGPFPFLILQGPPASGKSCAARLLRSVIDPSTSPFTPIPTSVRDLQTLACHNWILAFDHVTAFSPLLTDALCRLTSGLGSRLRDTSGPTPVPLQQSFKRPLLLTVTDRWFCPTEIAERALIVNLPHLPPDSRRGEENQLAAFNQSWPAILGALCSAVSTALARSPQSEPLTGPCADALSWALAASPALGCTEEEMRQAFAPPPPPHPMVEAVRNLLHQRRRWTGTATELYDLLQPSAPGDPTITVRTPKGVSQQLNNCTLALADAGIHLQFQRLPGGTRIIQLAGPVCDASSEKVSQDASQSLTEPPQPTQTEELVNS